MKSHFNTKGQQLYKDDSLKIEYNENLKYIFVEWQRHVDSQEFRNLFTKAAEIALDKGCLYWLSDARAIHFIDFSDQNWTIRVMGPLLSQSKLLKFARITNRESMALLDTHRVYTELERSVSFKIDTELQIFSDKEEAMEWLFADL